MAEIISLAAHRTLRRTSCGWTRAYAPPIRYAPAPPDPAALAITCLLWWSAVLQVAAGQVAVLNRGGEA